MSILKNHIFCLKYKNIFVECYTYRNNRKHTQEFSKISIIIWLCKFLKFSRKSKVFHVHNKVSLHKRDRENVCKIKEKKSMCRSIINNTMYGIQLFICLFDIISYTY